MKIFCALNIALLSHLHILSMQTPHETLPFANQEGIKKLIKLVEEAPQRPQAIQNIPHNGLRNCCQATATLYHAPGFNPEQHRLALMTLFIDAVQARLVLPHAKEMQNNLAQCHTIIDEQYDYLASLLYDHQNAEQLVEELKTILADEAKDKEKLKLKAEQLEKDNALLKLQLDEAQKNREKEYHNLNQAFDRIQAQVTKSNSILDQFPKQS